MNTFHYRKSLIGRLAKISTPKPRKAPPFSGHLTSSFRYFSSDKTSSLPRSQRSRSSIEATAYFFNGTTDGAAPVLNFGVGKEQATNIKTSQSKQITVMDIRYHQPPMSLAREGCEFIHAPTELREQDLKLADSASVKAKVEGSYYQECAKLVQNQTGALKAVAYHHRHREQKLVDIHDVRGFSSKPVTTFHVDNDAETAERNLRNTVGDKEAEEWLGRHWGIVNVWRSLGDVVKQFPLALLDSRHYDMEKAAVPISTLNNYKSHFLGLKSLPEYKFYYVSDLAPDEALIFVDYDSQPDSHVSGLGHGAIRDHSSPADAPLRRSIEVRVLVLYG